MGTIAGYYTLSAAEISLSDVPQSEAARLPLYPSIPVARVGRLAVDRRFQGQKIGTALIGDAVVRASTSDVAVFAVIVDAKDAISEAFYRHHGFVNYGAEPGMLIAPIKKLLGR